MVPPMHFWGKLPFQMLFQFQGCAPKGSGHRKPLLSGVFFEEAVDSGSYISPDFFTRRILFSLILALVEEFILPWCAFTRSFPDSILLSYTNFAAVV